MTWNEMAEAISAMTPLQRDQEIEIASPKFRTGTASVTRLTTMRPAHEGNPGQVVMRIQELK